MDTFKKDIEESVSVGAMLPVTTPDQVLSKQAYSAEEIDAEYDALSLFDNNTDKADEVDHSDESFEEDGKYTKANAFMWGLLPYACQAKKSDSEKANVLKLASLLAKKDKKFLHPSDLRVETYKAKSSFKKETLDDVTNTDKKAGKFTANVSKIFFKDGKKIFGYANTSLTKASMSGFQNFYFNLYDKSLSKYENLYLAYAASLCQVNIKKATEWVHKTLNEMENYNESADERLERIAKSIGLPFYECTSEPVCDFDSVENEPFLEASFMETANDMEFYEASEKKIDEDIRDVIQTLNEKGYGTKYSCSGHPSARFKKDIYKDGILNEKLYSTARIIFDKIYDLPSIPKGWSKRVLDDNKTAIYVKPPRFKIINGLPEKQFENWKSRYMYALNNWVKDLPKAGDVKEDEDSKITLESVMDDLILSVYSEPGYFEEKATREQYRLSKFKKKYKYDSKKKTITVDGEIYKVDLDNYKSRIMKIKGPDGNVVETIRATSTEPHSEDPVIHFDRNFFNVKKSEQDALLYHEVGHTKMHNINPKSKHTDPDHVASENFYRYINNSIKSLVDSGMIDADDKDMKKAVYDEVKNYFDKHEYLSKMTEDKATQELKREALKIARKYTKGKKSTHLTVQEIEADRYAANRTSTKDVKKALRHFTKQNLKSSNIRKQIRAMTQAQLKQLYAMYEDDPETLAEIKKLNKDTMSTALANTDQVIKNTRKDSDVDIRQRTKALDDKDLQKSKIYKKKK